MVLTLPEKSRYNYEKECYCKVLGWYCAFCFAKTLDQTPIFLHSHHTGLLLHVKERACLNVILYAILLEIPEIQFLGNASEIVQWIHLCLVHKGLDEDEKNPHSHVQAMESLLYGSVNSQDEGWIGSNRLRVVLICPSLLHRTVLQFERRLGSCIWLGHFAKRILFDVRPDLCLLPQGSFIKPWSFWHSKIQAQNQGILKSIR